MMQIPGKVPAGISHNIAQDCQGTDDQIILSHRKSAGKKLLAVLALSSSAPGVLFVRP
jgi:hypothetical protein